MKLCNHVISAFSLFSVSYVFLNNYCRFPGLHALSARRGRREVCSSQPLPRGTDFNVCDVSEHSMQLRKGRMVQRLKEIAPVYVENQCT